jgi:hypothetical protein
VRDVVGRLQDLRVVAPQLLAHPIGEPSSGQR